MNNLMPSVSAGFDSPLDLLLACHRRIIGFCDTLERLQEHLQVAGADAQAQAAAGRILNYFDRAAPLHHQDEEEDLLPRMQRRLDAAGERGLVEGWRRHIAAEHVYQAEAWNALRPQLQAINEGHACPLDQAGTFITLEREHVRFEEEKLFSVARRILSADDLSEMGRAMANRRGVHDNVI